MIHRTQYDFLVTNYTTMCLDKEKNPAMFYQTASQGEREKKSNRRRERKVELVTGMFHWYITLGKMHQLGDYKESRWELHCMNMKDSKARQG